MGSGHGLDEHEEEVKTYDDFQLLVLNHWVGRQIMVDFPKTRNSGAVVLHLR